MKKVFLLVVVTFVTFACSKDSSGNKIPLNVKEKSITLKVGGETKIKATSSEKITYKSENPIIATVEEDGTVHGFLKGNTTITVSDGSNSIALNVVVLPTNFYFEEPAIGLPKDELLAKYEKSVERIVDNGDSVVLYFGSGNSEYAYVYIFKEELKKGASLQIPNSSFYTTEDVLEWLKQRYVFVEEENRNFYFSSPDKKITVLLEIKLGGIHVLFVNSENN